jgi:hypothetical protein
MSESCNQSERLLCTKCALQHGHATNYVLIEELLQSDEYQIENWPLDEAGRKVRNLLLWTRIGSAARIIENLFDDVLQQITTRLRAVKQTLLDAFATQSSLLSNETRQTDEYY